MEPTKPPQQAPPTETNSNANANANANSININININNTINNNINNMLLSKVLPKPIPGTAVRVYLIRHGETHWNRRGKIQGGGYDVPLNATGKEQAMRAASALEGIPLDVVASSSLSRAKETADILLEHHCISSSSNNSGNNNNNNNKKPMRIVDGGFNEMRFGKFEGLGYRKNKEDITKEGDGNINDESLNESRLAIFLVAKSKVAKDREFCFPSRGDISDNDNDDEIYWRINADDETFRIENDSGKGESTRNVEDRALEALSKAITRVLENDKDPNTTTTTTTTTTKHVAIVSHGRTNKVMISAMISAKDKIGQGNTSINVLDHPGLEVGGDVDGDGYMKGWTARLLNYTDHVEEK